MGRSMKRAPSTRPRRRGAADAAGVPVAGPYYDIQIAEPLLCETRMSYSLESLSQIYLDEGKKDDEMEAYNNMLRELAKKR
jgi:hypothetical protein